jgi:hypothetical protein
MTAPPLDDFMLRLAPAPPLPVDARLLSARESVRTALGTLRGVPDSALERSWQWLAGEVDVRYGFYRQFEALEDARAQVRPLLSRASAGEAPARPLVAAATAARWELHGFLAALRDEDLDRDPGDGQWTIRRTLAHVVNGQRRYGWFTAWWLSRRDAPADDYPETVPDDVTDFEETEALGSLAGTQADLDQILDLSAGIFAPLGAEELAVRARWSRLPVDVRFRLLRWSSHLREHTVQIEKTLGFIGRPISEVERLLRLVAAAYGRLEEDVFMWPPGQGSVEQALELVETVATAVATDAGSVSESAAA